MASSSLAHCSDTLFLLFLFISVWHESAGFMDFLNMAFIHVDGRFTYAGRLIPFLFSLLSTCGLGSFEAADWSFSDFFFRQGDRRFAKKEPRRTLSLYQISVMIRMIRAKKMMQPISTGPKT